MVLIKTDYCVRCDTVWASPGKCRCNMFKRQYGKFNTDTTKYSEEVVEWAANEFERNVWNAAIEAAAKLMDEMGEEARITHYIRKLKK